MLLRRREHAQGREVQAFRAERLLFFVEADRLLFADRSPKACDVDDESVDALRTIAVPVLVGAQRPVRGVETVALPAQVERHELPGFEATSIRDERRIARGAVDRRASFRAASDEARCGNGERPKRTHDERRMMREPRSKSKPKPPNGTGPMRRQPKRQKTLAR